MSQYFENDKNIVDEKKLIKVKFYDKEYDFYTNNGIFSKDKLDYGSRLLLENLPNLKGRVLDLGCGYGIIGIILAYNEKISVDMVDVNKKALELSSLNAKLNNRNNVNIYESNIYENVRYKYNYIITNPPIRAGKDIVRKFLKDARYYLEDDGELWFVMRKDHGVKSIMKELNDYYDITIIKKDKGFYIIKGIPLKKM